MIRTFAAMLGVLALAGCAAEHQPPEQPAFYLDMAHGGAKLDAAVAASMISGYRANNGLGPVTVDPELMKVAETQSMAMAKRNKMDHDVAGKLTQAAGGGGLSGDAGGREYRRRLSYPRRGFLGLARFAPPSGEHAEERRHKIGHRRDLCSGQQIQGVLDAGSGFHRRAINVCEAKHLLR